MPAVLTLAGGRDAQLANLVSSLDAGTRAPDELVVADLGGKSRIPRARRFGVRRVALDVAGGLPYAGARNAAAAATAADVLIFLDVDCMASRGLVETYARAVAGWPGIVMGGVTYLRAGEGGAPGDDEALRELGAPHPARPLPGPGVTPTHRYELFWSLSFALSREVWDTIGGFDPGYRGYGAEDTDFAFAARAAGVPLAWTGGAECFHQHHPQYLPPLDRLDAVALNARRFRSRWGRWPMEGWLAALDELGLISWEPGGERLEVLREPTPAEVEAARVT